MSFGKPKKLSNCPEVTQNLFCCIKMPILIISKGAYNICEHLLEGQKKTETLKTGCHTNRLTISSGISSFPCLLGAQYKCPQLHCKSTIVKHLCTLSGYIYRKLLLNTKFLHDTESNNAI